MNRMDSRHSPVPYPLDFRTLLTIRLANPKVHEKSENKGGVKRTRRGKKNKSMEMPAMRFFVNNKRGPLAP